MSARPPRRHVWHGLKAAAALLIVVGLFLLGVLLTPPDPAVQAVSVQPIAHLPGVPQPNASAAVNGTLASFTALIPEHIAVYIPSAMR